MSNERSPHWTQPVRRSSRQPEKNAQRDRNVGPSINAHRAALEALFKPKTADVESPVRRESVRVVTTSNGNATDPSRVLHDKLIGKLLGAEGPQAISKAADEFLRAGFPLPETQEVHLQLLEDKREERIRVSLEALSRLLEAEIPHRKAVLDSRLRRIEDVAEDQETRELTSALRRKLSARR